MDALEAAREPEDDASGLGGGGGVYRKARKRAMDGRVPWVTKVEAVREMEVSASTLDGKIRRGEIEIRREDRRVFVRKEEPEYVSDDELLGRALVREDKLQRAVWELDLRASELDRELDEAREAASTSRLAYAELGEAYRKERATHGHTRRLALQLGMPVFVMLVLLVASVLVWWLVFR